MVAEGTHTSESIFGLGKALSRGGRLWAGKISLAAHDGDYITTGLDTIEAVLYQVEDAAVDANTAIPGVKAIAAGKVTIIYAAKDAYGDPGASIGYLTIVGTARGYHA